MKSTFVLVAALLGEVAVFQCQLSSVDYRVESGRGAIFLVDELRRSGEEFKRQQDIASVEKIIGSGEAWIVDGRLKLSAIPRPGGYKGIFRMLRVVKRTDGTTFDVSQWITKRFEIAEKDLASGGCRILVDANLYRLVATDQSGNRVAGLSVGFHSTEEVFQLETDKKGEITFFGDPHDHHIAPLDERTDIDIQITPL